METKINFEISDLYGGDGFLREIQEEEKVYSKTDKTTAERYKNQDIKEAKETKTRIVTKQVNTFRKDEEGNYTQRLGGSHGKLWGSMKAAGIYLVESKNKTFLEYGVKSMAAVKRMFQTINMSPTYPKLNGYNKEDIWIDKIPQIMAGFGNAMIIQNFDVITKTELEMTLIYPEEYHKLIVEILKTQELIPTLNKRRSTIKVLNREIFDA